MVVVSAAQLGLIECAVLAPEVREGGTDAAKGWGGLGRDLRFMFLRVLI